MSSNIPEKPLIVSSYPSKGKQAAKTSPIEQLNCDSEPESSMTASHGLNSAMKPVGTPASKIGDCFSHEAGISAGHYLTVAGVPVDEIHPRLGALRKTAAWNEISSFGIKEIQVGEVALHLCVDNLCKYEDVQQQLRKTFGSQVSIQKSNRTTFNQTTNIDTPAHDGQVMFVVEYHSQHEMDSDLADVKSDLAQSISQVAGPDGVFAMRLEHGPKNNRIELRVELSSLKCADACIEAYAVEKTKVVKEYVVYVKESSAIRSESRSSSSSGTGVSSGVFSSSSGRSRWTYDAAGNQISLPPQTVVYDRGFSQPGPVYADPSNSRARNDMMVLYNQATHSRNNHNGIINRQTLDLDNIYNGSEMRTTVMLRNIPNSFTVWDVKSKIDRSLYGRYDFLYVRMDFAKDANVGYGFINLVHPGDVVTLAHALDGASWDAAGRGRYVGLSYATIQGIDCIRQKFRNSAVMTEAPDYRPKLFISYADIGQLDDFGFLMAEHQVGSERRFPLPDNDSKRMRSIGNAQTQGLWAPSRGRRMANRFRFRSQYDRGTTQQIREDFGYDGEYALYGNASHGGMIGNFYAPAPFNNFQQQMQGQYEYDNGMGFQPRYYGSNNY